MQILSLQVMKKLFFILFLLTYAFSSSGITLQFHFCCGKLKNIEWSASARHNCDNKEMADRPCCETKSFSIEEDQTYDKTSELPLPLKVQPETVQSWLQPSCMAMISKGGQPVAFHPPSANSTPLFILNCVYRL